MTFCPSATGDLKKQTQKSVENHCGCKKTILKGTDVNQLCYLGGGNMQVTLQ